MKNVFMKKYSPYHDLQDIKMICFAYKCNYNLQQETNFNEQNILENNFFMFFISFLTP